MYVVYGSNREVATGRAALCRAVAGAREQPDRRPRTSVRVPGSPRPRIIGAAMSTSSAKSLWVRLAIVAVWAVAFALVEAMVVVYLFLAMVHPKIPFGLVLFPLALALIGAGTFSSSAASSDQRPSPESST